jgi:hypothetical protein
MVGKKHRTDEGGGSNREGWPIGWEEEDRGGRKKKEVMSLGPIRSFLEWRIVRQQDWCLGTPVKCCHGITLHFVLLDTCVGCCLRITLCNTAVV